MSHISHVQSVDSTRIGYRTSGTGPPLVLVHGASADSTVMSLVTPLLESYYTVHAVDRRGRGLSGDAPGYDITREYADVAAVVDHVARASGRAVSLYGHSYGAVCALGAALRTGNVERLFLYEPGFGAVLPPRREVLDRVDELAVAGEQAIGMSADDVAAMRRQPNWPAAWPPCPPSRGSFGRRPTCGSTRRRTATSPPPACCCSATAARPARSPLSRRSTPRCEPAPS